MNLLFVCRYNEKRSCTAETIFAAEGYSVKSAGTSRNATVTLSDEIKGWADIIFTMEEKHRAIITNYFSDSAQIRRL